jgi:hypothetical protein
MALTSITAALAQYNTNALWHESTVKANLALEAVRYLIVNRAQSSGHAGTNLNYEMLQDEAKRIEKYLGLTGAVAASARNTGLFKFRKV